MQFWDDGVVTHSPAGPQWAPPWETKAESFDNTKSKIIVSLVSESWEECVIRCRKEINERISKGLNSGEKIGRSNILLQS